MKHRAALISLLFSLGACGGGGGSGSGSGSTEAPSGSPPPSNTADITVLMLGNSHTTGSQLPQQLEALLRAGLPGKTVAVVAAPASLFLDEHLRYPPTMALLRSRAWSAVVFQAQKYSTTGAFSYSTDEAKALVAEARKVQALPVMFPEWPRRGVPETARIHALHVSIARDAPACVAPVGQAWDLALSRNPSLSLHAGDGNHSAPAGAHLTALMLYTTLTAKSPLALTGQGSGTDFGVSAADQALLRQAAADTAQHVPPRQHCPGDKAIGE